MEKRAVCATGMPPVRAQTARPWAGPGQLPAALSAPLGVVAGAGVWTLWLGSVSTESWRGG